MQQPANEKFEPPQTVTEHSGTQGLLDDVVDTEQYQKSMRNARVWLYVIAGFQLLMGVLEYYQADERTEGIVAFCIDAFIALLFLALALWSRKHPVQAFTSALIAYAVFLLVFAYFDIANLYRGVIFKVLIILALVKANKDARKYEQAKSLIS